MTVNPGIMYKVNKDTRLVCTVGVNNTAEVNHDITLSYDLKQNRHISILFQRSFKNWGESLEESRVQIQYATMGYAFKMPIYCYNQKENNQGLLMTCLLFAASNAVTYFVQKKIKDSKNPN